MIRLAETPRVVFDCNVVVQAIANDTGPSGQAVGLLDKNRIRVFTSRAALKELRLVLNYPTVRQKLPGLDDARIEAFMQRFVFRATLVRKVGRLFHYPRAKQDEPYLDLAAAAKATHLVSQDSDLLSLASDHTLIAKEFRQKCPGLRIVDPITFLSLTQ
ncbi:MAG TPA: putative toxin-antitoxin system toxin component, PIN family [Tepidisphaeraceae bacterium]|nr:putative toxin-antitoxin system toxin component, PIN family [Tepidisphaeraceae bacterium]HUB26429.1 putative toxin-antitoxin system toxin component, PIN family [Tepidisphaeraceae bacterium]